MNYIELSIENSNFTSGENEILIAFLLDAGFESFEEGGDNFLMAYCPENQLTSDVPLLMESFSQGGKHKYSYTIRQIPEKNWNEQWEKNFSPIVVDNRILIRAPFHKMPDYEFTIVIEPKMSFGTGHHETTRLMLREMLQLNLSGKEVLDMGCGTGILGITAKLMGASYVLAVDFDEWAFQNSYENFQRNKIEQPYDVFPGDSSVLEGHTFHVILANINRNILLNDMQVYFNTLKEHGTLIISGIQSVDKDVLLMKTNECGYTFVSSFYENNWISLNLRK
jgi:ribosomal protein L11 methyltransferase